jgi:hypothetical protein
MSGLASRIKETRTRGESVGARSFLVPSPLLGSTLLAVAATETPAQYFPADVPPESHLSPLDVPAPPPLDRLRGAPLTASPKAGSRKSAGSKKAAVAKQAPRKASVIAPVRMKPANGTQRNGDGVVHVTLKRKAPTLDAPEKALAWLQGMVKKVNISAIPTMLDYYRRLGWIPNEAYGWLLELSTGLTKSAQPATWKMVKNDPAQLAAIHRESYKHLKALFGARMQTTF